MKTIICLSLYILLSTIQTSAQVNPSEKADIKYTWRTLTLEPAIGLEPMSDLLISNLVQWNIKKRLSLVSYTSYAFNNAMKRTFNYITTEYNYAITQKFGIGTSLYTNHSSHTFSILAGIRYNAFKETLRNPELQNISASVNSFSFDPGVMYNIKIGKKKYFFSFRMFVPLSPYPFLSSDTWSIGENMYNLTLEFGFGIRLI